MKAKILFWTDKYELIYKEISCTYFTFSLDKKKISLIRNRNGFSNRYWTEFNYNNNKALRI